MIRIFIAMLILGAAQLGFAKDLEEGGVYRLSKSVDNLVNTRTNTANVVAAKDSKFVVVDNVTDANSYIIRFITIYSNEDTKSTAKTDEEYKIDRAVGGISLTKSVLPSFAGPASGPLIVPFKYRLNDKSLTGESAIGYYAGYRIEPRIPLTNTRVPLSPFIAGGLTQINMATNGDTDNKTGVTIAVGFLVQNWAGVNIGLVGGQDRIGNGAWVHEGKNWVSFMIGWNL